MVLQAGSKKTMSKRQIALAKSAKQMAANRSAKLSAFSQKHITSQKTLAAQVSLLCVIYISHIFPPVCMAMNTPVHVPALPDAAFYQSTFEYLLRSNQGDLSMPGPLHVIGTSLHRLLRGKHNPLSATFFGLTLLVIGSDLETLIESLTIIPYLGCSQFCRAG